MVRKRARYLAWKPRVDRVPKGISHIQLYETLVDSVQSGTYTLPRGWAVTIRWRNRPDAEWKSGPWTQVLQDSAGTTGWDTAFEDYLLEQLEDAVEAAEEKRADALRRLDRAYEERDRLIRDRNARGELSDIRATIERTRLRQWRDKQRRELRGADA